MTAYVAPRRVTSTPTTITVQAAASSALQAAAQAMSSNTFRAFNGHSTTLATDTTLAGQPGGLNYRAAHYLSGYQCDVTEDGENPTHTTLDWGGSGCWYPGVSAGQGRVMFAGKGTGNAVGNIVGGWPNNTQAIYSEASASWSATRGWKAADQAAATARATGHQYDNNALSIVAKKFFKKQLNADGFGSGPIHQFDLQTNTWGNMISPPANDPSTDGYGAMESVETATGKAGGALWYFNMNSAQTANWIREYDIANGVWGSPFGSFPALDPLGLIDPNAQGAVLSFNPRAFGGVGGVLVAGGSTTAYTVRCDTLAITAVTGAPVKIGVRYQGNVCAHPTGTGWLLFTKSSPSDPATLGVWSCDGASWTRLVAPASVPANYVNPAMCIPIADYGVVWLIAQNTTAGTTFERAWLYKA